MFSLQASTAELAYHALYAATMATDVGMHGLL